MGLVQETVNRPRRRRGGKTTQTATPTPPTQYRCARDCSTEGRGKRGGKRRWGCGVVCRVGCGAALTQRKNNREMIGGGGENGRGEGGRKNVKLVWLTTQK